MPDDLPNGAKVAAPHFGLVIDNADIATTDSFPVFDSITGSPVHSAPASTVEQAIEAVESADRAFETWRDTTPIQRREILNKAAQILEERKDELVRAMVAETGAKPSWAAFNIKTGIQFVMEGAGMVTQVKGELLQSNDKGKFLLFLSILNDVELIIQEPWPWSSKNHVALYSALLQ